MTLGDKWNITDYLLETVIVLTKCRQSNFYEIVENMLR